MPYLINKSTANVSLLEGRILIAQGGSVQVSDKEAEHDDIIASIRRGWIALSEEDPGQSSFVKPEIKLQKDEMKGSLTMPKVGEDTVEEVKEPSPVAETEAPVAETKSSKKVK